MALLSDAQNLWSDSELRRAWRLRPGAWRVAWTAPVAGDVLSPEIAWSADCQLPKDLDAWLCRALEGREVVDWRPSEVESGHRLREGFAADIWIRRKTKWIFIDLHNSEVRRWHFQGVRPDYRELRSAFVEQGLSTPFEVSLDNHWVLEPIVEGLPLNYLGPADQIAALQRLIKRFADLARETAAPKSNLGRDQLGDILAQSPIREARRRRLEIMKMFGVSSEVLGVPSHGDLKGHNVRATDSGVYLIDFDELAYRPFWVDATMLVLKTSPELISTGAFDAGIEGVFKAVTGSPSGNPRAVLLLAELCAFAIKADKQRIRRQLIGRRLRLGQRRRWNREWERRRLRFTTDYQTM